MGLQIGKVIQLKDNDSPDRDFRIKVQIPGIHASDEGVWARLANLQAGNQRGAVFLPELEDEVIVGYIGQDSREPVILGALYSETNPPPFENDDNNFMGTTSNIHGSSLYSVHRLAGYSKQSLQLLHKDVVD